MKILSQEAKTKVEEKIKDLERHTSCEFVCVFRERSSPGPAWLSYLMPKAWSLYHVETSAHLAFLYEEIFATEQRTGIMIYISERERAVYVMADKGVTAKIPVNEFGMLGQKLAKDFSKRTADETFLKALDEIAKRLGEKFPPRPNNTNELSNQIR